MSKEDAAAEIARARHELMLMEMRLAVEEFWRKPRPAQPPRLVVVREGPPTSRASHSS
jgi:hypothetical protein